MSILQLLTVPVKVLSGVLCCYFIAIWRLFVPPTPKSIKGKLVLITGGGQGIGQALAFEFARHGANIVLWDICQESCDQTAEDIRSATGVQVKSYVCDVTDFKKVKATATVVRKDIGQVDILVNNAGISYGGPILERPEDKIARLINVNTVSHFWTVKEFLPHMLEQKEGHIVCIASVAAQRGLSLFVDYSASKYGVRGFYEALRDELRAHYKTNDIHLSVVYPNLVRTQLAKDATDAINFPGSVDDFLSPEYVAKEVLAGVLRNKQLIFVPAWMTLLQFLQVLMPTRAVDLIIDALNGNK